MFIQKVDYGTPEFDEIVALCQEELMRPNALDWSEEALSVAYKWKHYGVYDNGWNLLAAATLVPDEKKMVEVMEGNDLVAKKIPRKAEIIQILVKKEPRGKGIGTQLFEKLQRKAAQEGIYELTVNAYHDAIPFFEKHGFTKRGKASKQQQWMQKRLAELSDEVPLPEVEGVED
jgi:GNAT superfamily N-acetyltransferase